MKTFFTLLLSLTFSLIFAQENFFVHTSTAENVIADATIIDNPLLNNNPSAKPVISHLFGTEFNNNVAGVYYDVARQKWAVYNESGAIMISGHKFFIYVADGAHCFQHDATSANTIDFTMIDNPLLNGNPSKDAVITHVYVNDRVNKNIGLYYSTSNWYIYDEATTGIPVPSSYFVAVSGATGVESYRHQATAGNVAGNYTTIDHPKLNNNPDAKFVFSHNWGVSGDSSNLELDEVLGTWYDGANWIIYIERADGIMPVNAMFNLLIDNDSMGVNDLMANDKTTAYPNPIIDEVNFTSKNTISQVNIYNVNGQEVMKQNANAQTLKLNVSNLTSGVYVAKIQTDKGTETIKLIKK